MIDLTYSSQGKLKRINTVEQKALNLIYIQKGSLVYWPNFGFDLAKYIKAQENINFSNIQSEINNFLLLNQVKISHVDQTIQDLILNVHFLVTQNN